MFHIPLTIIFAILLLPGLIAITMALPGVPYMFIVALLYGVIDGFTHLTLPHFAILGGIIIATLIIDQLAGFIAARWGGARGKTFLYGIAGVIVGTFVFPLFGGLIGLFIGILVGELLRRHKEADKNGEIDHGQIVAGSLKAATAGAIGTLSAIIIDLCLGVLFIALFLTFAI